MTEKLRLDIPIMLPGIPDTDDACVARLTSEIQSREGVEEVHVAAVGPGEPAQLCIHYDPSIVPLPRIRELVASAEPGSPSASAMSCGRLGASLTSDGRVRSLIVCVQSRACWRRKRAPAGCCVSSSTGP